MTTKRDGNPAATERLLLRRWTETDREPFARLNSDPRVTEFLPRNLSREESNELADRIEAGFREHGFGLWAAERRADGVFLGYIGLAVPSFRAHFTPCVEIGWRLAADAWGQGLASEGAEAVLAHAFGALELAMIVSFTVPQNRRSRRVMEKLGMTHDPADDFEHPALPAGHPLRSHVLYRIVRSSLATVEGVGLAPPSASVGATERGTSRRRPEG
jgi:RimJ/RimL family protein N-acetyltransferase